MPEPSGVFYLPGVDPVTSEWRLQNGKSRRGRDVPEETLTPLFYLYKYMEELCVTFAHSLAPVVMLSLQHNPIPGPPPLHTSTELHDIGNKQWLDLCFSGSKENTRRRNTPFQGDLESNTAAMQAIRHAVHPVG